MRNLSQESLQAIHDLHQFKIIQEGWRERDERISKSDIRLGPPQKDPMSEVIWNYKISSSVFNNIAKSNDNQMIEDFYFLINGGVFDYYNRDLNQMKFFFETLPSDSIIKDKIKIRLEEITLKEKLENRKLLMKLFWFALSLLSIGAIGYYIFLE